jgi:superoxide dismutase, Cu-Zn family
MRAALLAALFPLLLLSGCDRPSDPADSDPVSRPALPTSDPAPDAPGSLTDPVAEPAADGSPTAGAAAEPASALALAVLRPTEGNQASGELLLMRDDGAVRISGRISGLQPDSEHGFHIHENGDCSAPDASSAGGHFAPGGTPHGEPGSAAHHAGDMPNLKSDADGIAEVDLRLDRVELGSGGDTDIVGRAVVVHGGPDDYQSQPAGDSGPRIACGVITLGERQR